MLSAADVTAKRFSPTKFREGYDQQEVDALLERVAAALGAEAPGADAISADEVVRARFRPTKFREGYDQDEVDDFLDRVTAALRERQA